MYLVYYNYSNSGSECQAIRQWTVTITVPKMKNDDNDDGDDDYDITVNQETISIIVFVDFG